MAQAQEGVNLWPEDDHVRRYLAEADSVPHRREGEAVLLELLPQEVGRVLDLGTGDGRLLQLIKAYRPGCQGIGIEFSPAMLKAAASTFSDNEDVEILQHDLDVRLPSVGTFDLVVSSFAIHHLVDSRKRDLFEEVFELLSPGGLFCNLEHVASPTEKLHVDFLSALAKQPHEDDPSNKLASVELQSGWLSAIGFEDVDCYWKWRELALLAGVKPAA